MTRLGGAASNPEKVTSATKCGARARHDGRGQHPSEYLRRAANHQNETCCTPTQFDATLKAQQNSGAGTETETHSDSKETPTGTRQGPQADTRLPAPLLLSTSTRNRRPKPPESGTTRDTERLGVAAGPAGRGGRHA